MGASVRPTRPIWKSDEIIRAMQRWKLAFRQPPSLNHWNPALARSKGYGEIAARWEREDAWPHSRQVIAAFGSWNGGIVAAGFTPMAPGGTQRRHGPEGVRWTRRTILGAVRAWAREHESSPTSEDAERDAALPTKATVLPLFGSWTSMLRQAGLPAYHAAPWRRWSSEDALAALQTFAAHHGEAPTDVETRQCPDLPHTTTLIRLFGSFNGALRAAGLAARRSGIERTWTDEAIAEAFQVWMDQHGAPPRARDWQHARPEHPSRAVIYRRYGTWAAAVNHNPPI